MGKVWRSWNEIMDSPSAIRSEPLRPILENRPKEPQGEAAVPAPKVLFILNCEHVMIAPAHGDDRVYCGECKGTRYIKDVHVYEWHVNCATRGCSFARWTGLARSIAVFLATQHKSKHGDHNPQVKYEPNPTAVRLRQRLINDKVISP